MKKITIRNILSIFSLFTLALTGYHTVETNYSDLQRYVAEYPHLAYAEYIGVSTRDSLPIWGIKISDNPEIYEDEPSLLFTGAIHAEELIGTEICHFTIEYLLTQYGINPSVTNWLDNLQIYFIPIVNPEGHKIVTDSIDITFRKNKRDNNLNSIFDFTPGHGGDIDGVDINRNFPFNWEGGSSEFISTSYRGPSQGSENETIAIMDLAHKYRFVSSVFYHSSATGMYNEWIIYPWNWSGYRPPDYTLISSMASELSTHLQRVDGGYYSPWYSTSQNGNANDWQYTQIGTIPFLVEVDTTTQPEYSRFPEILENQLNGIEYLLDRSIGPGLCIRLLDEITHLPIEGFVEVLGYEDTVLTPRRTDIHGTHRRLLSPGNYTIVCSVDDSYIPDTSRIEITDGEFDCVDVYLRAYCPNVEETSGETRDGDGTRGLNPLSVYLSGQNLHISSNRDGYLTIYNIMGGQVFNRYIDKGSKELILPTLPSGMYLVRMNGATAKIVVVETR